MSDNSNPKGNRGARSIGALIGSVIAPICAKRGYQAKAPSGATLVIRVDAGMAIYLQHETSVVLDRINGFLGFGAVSQLKIVQGVVSPPRKAVATPPPLSLADEAIVADTVASVDSDGLREALARLGRGVYGSARRP
jgi:hypothetical protein